MRVCSFSWLPAQNISACFQLQCVAFEFHGTCALDCKKGFHVLHVMVHARVLFGRILGSCVVCNQDGTQGISNFKVGKCLL